MLTFFCLVSGSAWAQEFDYGGFTYEVLDANAKTAALSRVPTSFTGDVVIPTTVTNEGVSYTVTQIGSNASTTDYSLSPFYESNIESLTIPASVTKITGSMFYCSQQDKPLKKLTFQDSSTPVAFDVIGYLETIDELYLGRNIEHPTEEAAAVFLNMKKVEVGPNVTVIKKGMFQYCPIESFDLSNATNLTTIEANAFFGCASEALTAIDLSKTKVTSLGEAAFYGCSFLKQVLMPNTLTTIGNEAFMYCYALETVTIPASIQTIGDRVFYYTDNIKSFTIEDSSTPLTAGDIGYGFSGEEFYLGRDVNYVSTLNGQIAFENLRHATIGPNVTVIKKGMFQNRAVESFDLSNATSLTTIDANAFFGCDSEALTSIDLSKTKVTFFGDEAFYGCSHLKQVLMPNTLTTIGHQAFMYCYALETVTIPASVKTIGNCPFHYADNIKRFTIEDSSTPLTVGDIGYGFSGEELYLGRDVNYVSGLNGQIAFENLKHATIGPNVTVIKKGMFQGRAVETIDLSNATSLTAIEEYAFYGCTALEGLTIPASVQTFHGTALWSVYTDKPFTLTIEDSDEPLVVTRDYYATIENPTSVSLYLGRNIARPEEDFAAYPYGIFGWNLTTVTIGPKVTDISGQFKDLPNIIKVTAPWLDPIVIDESDFSNEAYENATLWIPGGTLQAYLDANWKFANIEFLSFVVSGTATKGGTLAFAGESVTNGTKTLLVDRESDVMFTVSPEGNYDFTSLTVNGEAVELANNTYTYPNLLTDIDVKATFTEKPKFEIKATVTGGTVSLNGANFSASQTIEVYRDTDVTLAIAANEGYEQPKVTINGQDVTAQLQDNQLKIENIQEAKTIVVTYVKKKFQIAAEPTQNGAIELSKNVVEWGDSFTATFVPANGYGLETATLDGEDVTAQVVDDVLTVTNVKANKTVGATFKRVVFNVTISGGGITVSNSNPRLGEDVTVTIEDDPDLTLVTLLVNGQDVTAQVVNGQYVIQNVTGDVTIEATFKSAKEFITMTGTYATFSCPQDLNFTGSDLRAYMAMGFNKNTNQVLLVRVYDVPAGTGLFLVGEPGTTYKIPYSENASYYVNLFVANLQKSTIYATAGNFSNYIFSEQDGDLGFYPIIDYVTLLAQTAYLQLPSDFVAAGVKVSVVFEDDVIDGIEDFLISDEDATIYDLAGRRLSKTQRGINIVNGKKVLVK